MKKAYHSLLLLLLCACAGGSAWAEKADRLKPMNVESDAMRYDDLKQTNVFTGRVVMNKGTIVIRGARVDVRQDAEGNQFGVVTAEPGKLAYFKQKRDGVDEYIEGEGETIEYSSKLDNVRFIKRKSDPFEFTGLESLNSKLVGTIRGYGYGDAFAASTAFKRENGNDLMTNIKKLLRHRIDLTLEDEIVARSIINTNDPEALKNIEFAKTPLSVNPLYITAGLQNPKAQEIIGSFNKGLEVIKANGTYDKIFKKYGIGK